MALTRKRIEEVRKSIDSCDRQIIALLAKRVENAKKILRAKQQLGIEGEDLGREGEVLQSVSARAQTCDIDADFAVKVFREVIDYSKEKQKAKQPLVAFQGEHGAYSEQAVGILFSKERTTLPCGTFREVFEAVKSGEADYGLVPIENSLEGSVNSVYDLLLEYDLSINKEVEHRITHCLVANTGTSLSSVEEVYSHPQALGQCKKYLEEKLAFANVVPYYDTAGAAKMLSESEKHGCAAIASKKAADYYGLKVLAEDIGNSRDNYTRFLLLSRTKSENCINPKTSIVFAAKHKPGALYSCLKPFADRKVNLTKLESRPAKQWEYVFYMDFVGGAEEKNLKEALSELTGMASFIKVLGVYESAKKA